MLIKDLEGRFMKKERKAEDLLSNENYSPGGFKPTIGKASAAVSIGSIAYRYPTTL